MILKIDRIDRFYPILRSTTKLKAVKINEDLKVIPFIPCPYCYRQYVEAKFKTSGMWIEKFFILLYEFLIKLFFSEMAKLCYEKKCTGEESKPWLKFDWDSDETIRMHHMRLEAITRGRKPAFYIFRERALEYFEWNDGDSDEDKIKEIECVWEKMSDNEKRRFRDTVICDSTGQHCLVSQLSSQLKNSFKEPFSVVDL